MEANVKWEGRMKFTGTAESGFVVPMGVRSEDGSEAEGFRPMELFAIALAGCTAMDVISILIKKRQDVTDFEVVVNTERAAEHPKVFTRAEIEYQVTGKNVEQAAVIRSIELSATRYCPAQAMFDQVIPIKLKYRIFEDLEGQGRKEVQVGVFEKLNVLETE